MSKNGLESIKINPMSKSNSTKMILSHQSNGTLLKSLSSRNVYIILSQINSPTKLQPLNTQTSNYVKKTKKDLRCHIPSNCKNRSDPLYRISKFSPIKTSKNKQFDDEPNKPVVQQELNV